MEVERARENAFARLKNMLTSPPILAYADYTLPFELHTDASGSGLGAILYQEKEGKKSRTTEVRAKLPGTQAGVPSTKMGHRG